MGGKSAPAPDYSGMERVANRQLDFAERQYEEMKPTLTGLADTMRQSQQQQMEQAKGYYDYNVGTFRPLERGLVADAERFSTEGYREQQARAAAASAAQAFGQTQAMSQRAMASRGVNPNSGAGLAMATQGNLGLAAQRANAMTGARQQAEGMGWARRMDAAGLGRNLAGASTAAYQGAGQAGSGAGAMYMAPGNQFQQGLSNAGTTFGNMANTQASVYNNAMNAEGEFYGALLGAGATMGGAAIGKYSDIRLKENIEEVGRDERTMLPLYEFEYKGGSGKRYLGVMAQDVEKKYPQFVFTMPDGFKAVDYAGLGIQMLEV